MDLRVVDVTPDNDECGESLEKHFMPPHRVDGYVRIGDERVFLTRYYLEFAEAIEEFEVYEDDVWVVSHPKAGTTWVQEMIWCIANDLDFESAKSLITTRCPFLEVCTLFRGMYEDLPFLSDSVNYCKALPRPRFIKSHLPWHRLPKQLRDNVKKPKIVYVSRNAKDTCLSYFNHCQVMEGFTGDLQTFTKLFLKDSLCYAPFWDHVISFWERREQSNVLFLRYEDMKKDLPSVIGRAASFLEKPLTETQVRVLADHLSFTKMKGNPAVNYVHVTGEEGKFMHSGEVGQWRSEMTPELVEEFDQWTRDRIEGTDLPY